VGEAEAAAAVGDSKALYRCVKELSGQRLPIKDDAGHTLKTHEEQAAR